MNKLSESDFLSGQRCSKLLWHRWHAPELFAPVVEGSEEAQVRRFARELFPDGKSVLKPSLNLNLYPNPLAPNSKSKIKNPKCEGGSSRGNEALTSLKTEPPDVGCYERQTIDFDELVAAARSALRLHVPLFHPAFAHNACCAQPDILRPAADGGWDLIGVTASFGAPRSLLETLAFQAYVVQGAEVEVRRVLVLRINQRYVRHSAVDPRQMLVLKDVTQSVAELNQTLEETIADQFAVLRRREPPEPGLGAYCETPADCPLKTRCWRALPERNVFELHNIRREQAFALARAGITGLDLLPEKLRATRHRQIQLTALATQRPHADRQAVATFLSSLRYPLYCLDFETIAPAVPPFDGLHPHEMIPFQFSLHVVAAEGLAPVHRAFLSDGRADPRPEILWRLREWLGERGTILAYNAKFEIGVLQYLGERFPEFQPWVAAVRPRFTDLLTPFKTFAFYHPAQKGSASLKAVLPALTGRGYDDLVIREGNTAGAEFARVTFGETTPEQRQRVREHLEQYCGRDTEGMVWIIEALRRLGGEGFPLMALPIPTT